MHKLLVSRLDRRDTHGRDPEQVHFRHNLLGACRDYIAEQGQSVMLPARSRHPDGSGTDRGRIDSHSIAWLVGGARLVQRVVLACLVVLGTACQTGAPANVGARRAESLGADDSVAFVDLKRAVLECKAGRALRTKLEEQSAAQRAALALREAEILELASESAKQKSVLSAAALEERAVQLVRLRSQLARDLEAAREELQVAERKGLRPLFVKAEALLGEFAAQRRLDAILDRSSTGLLFSSDALDITALLIERLDQQLP